MQIELFKKNFLDKIQEEVEECRIEKVKRESQDFMRQQLEQQDRLQLYVNTTCYMNVLAIFFCILDS
jgi:hypothetical protein